jgi:hypothetical protein
MSKTAAQQRAGTPKKKAKGIGEQESAAAEVRNFPRGTQRVHLSRRKKELAKLNTGQWK